MVLNTKKRRASTRKAVKTTCGVGVPYWYVDGSNFGHCLKIYRRKGGKWVLKRKRCPDTGQPCPLGGVMQFPRYSAQVADWMKDRAGVRREEYDLLED